MTVYLDGKEIDTSHIEYPKTGIRLLKFVKIAFGDEVLEKIEKGELVVWSHRHIKYDKDFRNYRIHRMTEIKVKPKEDEFNSTPPDFDGLA